MSTRIEKRLSVGIVCERCGKKGNLSFLLYSGASFISDIAGGTKGYFLCDECGGELERFFDNINRDMTLDKANKIVKTFVEDGDDDNVAKKGLRNIF